MDITPSYVEIGKLFERNVLFDIPKYQRYYAWDDEQVEDFIEDISKLINQNDKDHFFGGIVCVEKIVEGSNRQQREIVDGQQRITTTMLLVTAIYYSYRQIKDDIQDEELLELISVRMTKIERKYFVYDDEINRKPVKVRHLTVSDADKECYEAIIRGETIPENRDSHKKLKKAYDKIRRFVAENVSQSDDVSEKLNMLAAIEEVIDRSCTVIFIDAKTKKDAYALFQVLNDRGMGLTVGDLLKSKTLEIVAKDDSTFDEEALLRKWDEILSGENKAIDRFLRYYYMSVMGKRAGTNSLFDDYIEKIFGVEERKPEYTDEEINNVNMCVDIIHEASLKFYSIESGEWPYEDMQPITLWDRNRLKNLISYLDYDITLALLIASTKLSHDKFNDIVQVLEKFMFRYKGVCNNKHQKLGNIFMKEALKIRENPGAYRISSLTAQLRPLINESAGDDVFKEKLKSMKYVERGNNKLIKYLFATLNEYHKWYDDNAEGKPKAEKGKIINFEDVSIEHIFSQSPQDGDTIPDGLDDVNELKNLTILTLKENGDRVKNKKYEIKRDVYIDSEYDINTRFSQYEEWNNEAMNDWLNYILDLSCKIFVI
ncbi:DUF262 domain-containing protein [Lacrimispora sp.]|uniref:DUF262 domain-containing protein n=1 Tax=Lacrimispora sp. TaxID=2719234 RepID=UPI00399293F2